MRLEKGYLHWKADLIYEHNPFEARLDRFVKLEKDDFIGKSALLAQVDRGPRKLLTSLAIDCDFAPAHGGAPVFQGDTQVGSVTSAGYGHRVQKNLAYAYLAPACAASGTSLEVGILGARYAATVVAQCLYDPQNLHPRT